MATDNTEDMPNIEIVSASNTTELIDDNEDIKNINNETTQIETEMHTSNKNKSIDDSINISNTTSQLNSIISQCRICKHAATKKRGVLTCQKCTSLIHFQCTRLPPYLLYTLSTSTKKYVCEECAATPDEFLKNNNIINNQIEGDQERTVSDSLERKISEVYEYVEKYDLPGIVDKIQDGFNKMNKISDKVIENISVMNKMTTKYSQEHNTSNDGNILDTEIKRQLDDAIKEINSFKSAEKLLMSSLDEQGRMKRQKAATVFIWDI